jgi:hypothetical protein
MIIKQKTFLGRGVLNWPRTERISDRYGLVFLFRSMEEHETVDLLRNETGRNGDLLAHVLETRDSYHIGDMFRGIGPTRPEVGEDIVLGTGTLFFYRHEADMMCVGLEPDDGRTTDWLDPHQLYKVHHQTVELWFVFNS